MKFVDSLNNQDKIKSVQSMIEVIMQSGEYTEGQTVKTLEQEISEKYFGAKTLAFSNCGTALYTVFRYLKLHRLAERVVVQNNTFRATASMAYQAGLQVVLCDTNKNSPNMGVDSMIAAVEATKAEAVCLTHVGGWIAEDYELIAQYCQSKDIYLIEDAAHAFGVRASHSFAGRYGSAATFSFYPTKAVPGGEGGALITKDFVLHQFADMYRNYGKSYNVFGEIVYSEGFNFRMSEFDAAVALVQVRDVEGVISRRRKSAEKLLEAGYMCMMDEKEASNFYKYPTPTRLGTKTVGSVYSTTDQLLFSSQDLKPRTPVSLDNSRLWAQYHMCIPIGEYLYDGMSTKDVLKELAK